MASSGLKIAAAAAAILATTVVANAGQRGHKQAATPAINQTGLQTSLGVKGSSLQMSFENAAGFTKGQSVTQQIQQSVGAIKNSSALITGFNSTGPGF